MSVALLELIANLATRWRHLHGLQIWPPDGNYLHQLQSWLQGAPQASIENWVNKWNHLHSFKFCQQVTNSKTYTGSKFGHQIESLSL